MLMEMHAHHGNDSVDHCWQGFADVKTMKAFVDKIVAAGNADATLYTYPGEGEPRCAGGLLVSVKQPGARQMADTVTSSEASGCSFVLRSPPFMNEASEFNVAEVTDLSAGMSLDKHCRACIYEQWQS